MRHLTKEEKDLYTKIGANFRACARFLGVKEDYMYNDLFADLVKDKYSFLTFRTMLISNPSCLLRSPVFFKRLTDYHMEMRNKIQESINDIKI